jgi:hypothetical protein
MNMQIVNASELAALRIQAVNAITRKLAETGFGLTHDQVDELGDEGIDWIRNRLGLVVTPYARIVECTVAEKP